MARRRVRPSRAAKRKVEEALSSMLEVGMIEECGRDEKGEMLYGMTDWGRQFAFVEISAMLYEQKWLSSDVRPPMENYLNSLVKDLVMIMPLLKMPGDAEGACDLAVTHEGEVWGGLNVVFRAGKLVSHDFGFAADPRARVIGSFDSICLTVLRKRIDEGLVFEGDRSFGGDLVDAMIAESFIDPKGYESW